MFRNMNVRNLWTNQRASITVEFVFISIALITFMYFLGDLVLRQAMTGRLDRTSYSIAGVLRERIQLFDGREALTQNDVDMALSLTKKMLKDMDPNVDLQSIGLSVEEMHFYEPTNLHDTTKRLKYYHKWNANSSAATCSAPQPLTGLQELSPKGSYGRWVPLYQLSVCLPTTSWYTRLTTGVWISPVMSSFAIVMLR